MAHINNSELQGRPIKTGDAEFEAVLEFSLSIGGNQFDEQLHAGFALVNAFNSNHIRCLDEVDENLLALEVNSKLVGAMAEELAYRLTQMGAIIIGQLHRDNVSSPDEAGESIRKARKLVNEMGILDCKLTDAVTSDSAELPSIH